MYHYVRDYKNTKYLDIKGLDVRDFEFQIQYFNSKYNILNPKEIYRIVEEGKNFKSNDCWLTFDDGYIDHYNYVFPILEKYKIKASFFPAVKSILHETVLDVNKLHFILANKNNYDFIFDEIKNIFLNTTKENNVKTFEKFVKKIDSSHRYDDPKIRLIKSLLQFILPKDIRFNICDVLFKKYVSDNTHLFAKELYMNLSQITEIYKHGHDIGLHGYDHIWLGKLLKENQKNEILKALNFWKKNKIITDKFTMCYPYGSYNSDTLSILSEYKCSTGLTTKVGSVPDNEYLALELPRFDTNDFPQNLNEVNKKG